MKTTISHHGVSAALLLLSMISLQVLSAAQQGPLKSSCTSIATNQNSSSVNLTCDDDHIPWFHVIQMVYSTNNDSTDDITRTKSSSNHLSFGTLCVGKQNHFGNKCLQQVSRFNANELNGTLFVNLDYECINESLNYNMCEDVSLEIPGDVYLASPDMFGQPANNTLCRCHVKAAGLHLQALYIFLNDGNQLNMTCQQCSQYKFKYISTTVNINLTTGTIENVTYTLDMAFLDFKPTKSANEVYNRVWLKISGTQNITIQCNGSITVPLTTSTVISTTNSTAITIAQSTTQSGTPTNTGPTPSNNSSFSSTHESTTVHTGISSTSTSISTTQNTTAQTETTTSTPTSEPTTATSSSDSTHESTVLTTTSVDRSSVGSTTSSVVTMANVAGDSTVIVDYIIGGVVGGVVLLVSGVVIVVIICRRIRRRQTTEDIQGLYAVSPGTAQANSLDPNLASLSHIPFDSDYCEVDLDDGKTGKDHSGSTNDWFPNGQNTFAIDKTATATANGRSLQADQAMPMSTFPMKQKAMINERSAVRECPRQNETENKNFYFILEPEPEAAGDADSAGVSGGVKQASNAVAEKTAEDFDDESCHYYSQIKVNEKSPTTGDATASEVASSARREKNPFSIADYEEVDLSSDKDAKYDVQEKSGLQSSGPHRIVGSEPHNPMGFRRPRSTFSQKPKIVPKHAGQDGNDDDADELVMIDNVAYVSAGPPNANHNKSDTNDEDNDDDDELMMMDNVAYVSAGRPGSDHSKMDLNSAINPSAASATHNDYDDSNHADDYDESAPDDQAHNDQKEEEEGDRN